MNSEAAKFKSGFVALVGPTNAGKSTLLNSLMGEKISIVSKKPQTTYHRIRGILNTKEYQMVFTDLPGFQNRKENIHRLLNDVADKNAKDCDVVCFVLDVSTPAYIKQFESLEQKFRDFSTKHPVILLLNKIDLNDKRHVLPLIQKFHDMNIFKEIIPISALKGSNLEPLKASLAQYLPEGEQLYGSDLKTDRDDSFRYTEFIREKIYELVHEEIPYRVRIEMEQLDNEKEIPHFYAKIHVDSPSRKAILIGKQGQMLKNIGIRARKEIETITGKKICLKLFVDVEKEWLLDKQKVQTYLELN